MCESLADQFEQGNRRWRRGSSDDQMLGFGVGEAVALVTLSEARVRENARVPAVISSPIFDVFAVSAAAPRPRRGQVIYSGVSAAPEVTSPA